MSREALHESLSAVMDDEADELEFRRLLNAVGETELRDKWSRYQLARAVMHKEPFEPRLSIADAVSAALVDEPEHHVQAPARTAPRFWGGFGRVAVAASVTLAVLAGVRFYHQDDGATQLAQQSSPAASTPVQAVTVLAGYSDEGVASPAEPSRGSGAPNWQEQRLPSYLRQHAQQATIRSEGALPYARAASLEGR